MIDFFQRLHDRAAQFLRAARTVLAGQEKEWDSAFGAVGTFTESATGGVPAALLGAGFDVRRTAGPLPPMEAPKEVTVELTELPGESLLTWKRPKGAVAFVMQWAADYRAEASWQNCGTVTDTQAKRTVAEPGQRVWFRVAAVSSRGTGPWCMPVARLVL